MSRRQPTRRTSRSRRRTVAGPSPAQLAAAMVDAVAADLLDADPVQAQLVASYLVADRIEQYWDALEAAEDEEAAEAVPRPALGLLRLVSELRDPALRDAALSLSLALASLDPDDDAVQDAAAEAVKRLRFLGAKLPGWAEHILDPELLGVWCVRDVFGDALTLYVGTRHAGVEQAPAHCVAARIEQGRAPQLVDVFVSEGPEVLLPAVERTLAEDPEAALLVLEPVDAASAAALLWDVIADAEESFAEPLSDDGFDTFALLEARAMLLDAAARRDADGAPGDQAATWSPHRSALDELDADALLERFVTSAAYAGTDGTHHELAEVVVAWVLASFDEGVARFGPNLAVDLLSDLAEAAEDEQQQAALLAHGIATVRAWARFTATETELPEHALAELERLLDEVGHEFEHLVRTGAERSPLTDQIMELMLEDGVDVGDQDELDAWSARWNALTDEERITRLERLG